MASDDMKWCKAMFGDFSDVVFASDTKSQFAKDRQPTFDLALLSQCDHSIIRKEIVKMFVCRCFWLLPAHVPGTDIMIFKIFSPKKSAKILAFLTQNKTKFGKSLIITLVFEKNANFFAENCRKSQKIVIITSTPGSIST
jgi:hypothetical protein